MREWARWRDAGEKPPIGLVVENQDAVQVMWCGVNWWHATLWRTITVTLWRLPNWWQLPDRLGPRGDAARDGFRHAGQLRLNL